MNKIAIDIEALSVFYDEGKKNEKKAVDRFSLQVHEGEFFGLLGPNGAGKTSVISSITSLLDVRHGSIKIFGHPAGSLEAKKLMGIVPQELVHHGFFTVNEVLNFFSGYYGIQNNQERIDFLLDRLKLSDQKEKLVSQLSGGMKRRLLIAKALVHSPKLLLLDEPSAGVDIELRSSLWKFMTELNSSGVTILLTTHYLEEAQRLCGRVAIMNHGHLLSLDETGDLMAEMVDREFHLTLQEGSRLDESRVSRSSDKIQKVEIKAEKIKVVASGKTSLHEVLIHLGVAIESLKDVQMKEGALEDAFIKIVANDRGGH